MEAIAKKKKREAVIKTLHNGRKLHPLGTSFALILPRTWVDLYAIELDQSLWVAVDTNTPDKLILHSIDSAKLLQDCKRLLGSYLEDR